MNKVCVIGAGSWGTALAISAARGGSEVILCSRDNGIVRDINHNRKNGKYLGKIPIHENITATCDFRDMVGSNAVLLAIPAQEVRGVLEEVRSKKLEVRNSAIIICAKGVEQNSFALMSDVVHDVMAESPVAILSGPNFADEIARGLPACATLACSNKSAAEEIIQMLGNKLFRLYYSNDVVGAQIGGAVKNVIAIACGIAIGKGLGENARAALVTRGIAEMARISYKMGGRHETLMGLSGIGDIMLSCASEKSRNMYLGVQIGRGEKLANVMQGKTVEGVHTSKSVTMLAAKLGVDMPIANAVKSILHENSCIEETIESLLQRPFAVEGW